MFIASKYRYTLVYSNFLPFMQLISENRNDFIPASQICQYKFRTQNRKNEVKDMCQKQHTSFFIPK